MTKREGCHIVFDSMFLRSTFVLLYVLQVLHRAENSVALPNDSKVKKPIDHSQFHKGRPLMIIRDTKTQDVNRRTVPSDMQQPEYEHRGADANREMNLAWDERKNEVMKSPDTEKTRMIKTVPSDVQQPEYEHRGADAYKGINLAWDERKNEVMKSPDTEKTKMIKMPSDMQQPEYEHRGADANREMNLAWDERKNEVMKPPDTEKTRMNKTVPSDMKQSESERRDAVVNRETNLSWDDTKSEVMKPPDSKQPRVIRITRSKRSIRHCRDYNYSNTCISCVVGYFGGQCQYICHSRCIHGCLMEDGHCQSCNAGRFGHDCERTCSITCGSGECDVFTGRCLEGCKEGFWGEKCENTCGKCFNSLCHFEDGMCLQGCPTGFYGPRCDKPCPENCINNCSSSGVCETGCKPGLRGFHCNESCVHSCRVCSQHNSTCLEWDVDSHESIVNRILLGYSISVTLILLLIVVGFIISIRLGICTISMSSLKGRSPSQTKGLKPNGCVYNSQESDVSLIYV